MPILRGAPFVNHADLLRSTERQSFASEKAKQMMGAGNPLTGSAKRATASTACPNCGRWHRPGNLCPNTMKSLEPVSGERVESSDSVQSALETLKQMVADSTPRKPAENLSVQDTLLSQAPEEKKPLTPEDQQKQLHDGSEHLKRQSDGYLTAIRNWQSKFVGQ